MAKTVNIKFNGSIEKILNKAQEAAAKSGARFLGDGRSGSFTGHGVSGSYQVKNDYITININDKPFWAPWGMVESSIKGFFR